MMTNRALNVAVSGFPTERYDVYRLDQTEPRWPSLGSPSTPIVWGVASGGRYPLLPLPREDSYKCVVIRDLTYFARLLLPLVSPSRPLRSDQAIDLGDLIDLALQDNPRDGVHKGQFAILKDIASRGVGSDHLRWRALWWPRTAPISPQIATACVACRRGLTPEARRHIQIAGDTIPWRRACAIAAADPAQQLPLLSSLATIRTIRAVTRTAEEVQRDR